MKNKEYYFDEIIDAFCNRNDDTAICKFIEKYVFKEGCAVAVDSICLHCSNRLIEWMEEEYISTTDDIDWESVPIDTPVYVSNVTNHKDEMNIGTDDTEGFARHLYRYNPEEEYPFAVFAGGKTSFTTNMNIDSDNKYYCYKYAVLAMDEDIRKYMKRKSIKKPYTIEEVSDVIVNIIPSLLKKIVKEMED